MPDEPVNPFELAGEPRKSAEPTPGPWRVEAVFIAQQSCDAICFNEYRLNGYEVGGTTQSNPTEAVANARLMAAAPDLYDALAGALLSVEWRVNVMHGPYGINPDPEAHAALSAFALKCRAALEKARCPIATAGTAKKTEPTVPNQKNNSPCP